MNKAALFAVFAGLILVAAYFRASSAHETAPPEIMTLETSRDAEATQPPVVFPHARHEPVAECAHCHHLSQEGADPHIACKSTGCHDNYQDKKAANSYFGAFHIPGERSCLGCHRARTQAGETAGPTSCIKCHVRK